MVLVAFPACHVWWHRMVFWGFPWISPKKPMLIFSSFLGRMEQGTNSAPTSSVNVPPGTIFTGIPSSNQTWLAGASPNWMEVLIGEITYKWSVFQRAMFDYRRVMVIFAGPCPNRTIRFLFQIILISQVSSSSQAHLNFTAIELKINWESTIWVNNHDLLTWIVRPYIRGWFP